MRVQRGRSRVRESVGGQSSVMIDIRYMWSAMLSPWLMPKRRQPSRLVVFRRSSRWKKGIGVVGLVGYGSGKVDRTVCGVHCWWVAELGVRTPELSLGGRLVWEASSILLGAMIGDGDGEVGGGKSGVEQRRTRLM